MKTILILFIIIIAAGALFMFVCRPRHPEHLVNKIFKDISDRLDLNETQRTLLGGIKDAVIKNGREMHEDRERMHDDMKKLIMSERIDPDEVKAEANKKHEKMKNFIDLMVDSLAEFHATLTPEQKKSLVDLMEKHKKIRMRPLFR